jgi:hypothetical protein
LRFRGEHSRTFLEGVCTEFEELALHADVFDIEDHALGRESEPTQA